MARKRIDWLSVGIIAMLSGGALFFVVCMRILFE